MSTDQPHPYKIRVLITVTHPREAVVLPGADVLGVSTLDYEYATIDETAKAHAGILAALGMAGASLGQLS
jgi:hypothetical protein